MCNNSIREDEADPEFIALHEAGHGLVACWMADEYKVTGFPTIELDQQYTHYRIYPHFLRDEPRPDLLDEIIARIGLGGMVAQVIEYGPDVVGIGTTSDLESVENLGFSEEMNKRLRVSVEGFLMRERYMIKNLTKLLLKYQVLLPYDTRMFWKTLNSIAV